ncbi:MAG: helix-turn-helix transcriptional regulator [Dehalococcoidia bacterium]|nr:MAG: helix-turn-helix transcriptional regulator [Dehalococcoidia bacterium]
MVSSRTGALTRREKDVLALAGRGLTNQEIADELFISARTVKCTLHRACVRLGAHNRTQAVIQAIRRGDLHILEMFSPDDLAELLASLPTELMNSVYHRAQQNSRYTPAPSFIVTYDGGGSDKTQIARGVECVY